MFVTHKVVPHNKGVVIEIFAAFFKNVAIDSGSIDFTC